MYDPQSDLISENVTMAEDGSLRFAGRDLPELAAKYGTPLYLMDEDRIRERMRAYRAAVRAAFGERGLVLYASKACSFKHLYEIAAEESLGIDVVSSGEIETARRAGFPLENAWFHSNNKTDEDIRFAIETGVGTFVVDNEEELLAIERIAGEAGKVQSILLRLTPGIDPHTYEAVSTGKVDSKFGSAIETGQAAAITDLALSLPHIALRGFHCHVGSQVTDATVFLAASDVMLTFIAETEKRTGFRTELLDLGGGFGVRYVASQPALDIAKTVAEIGAFMNEKAAALGIALPAVAFEPGRSIVADAGLTLYTVGTVKRIPGFKNYVSVDGGMTDNIRYALYRAPYTILPVRDISAPRGMICSVVGRCCESGDILQENVSLPAGTKRGDLLACLTTGAYQYAMASNYNRVPRPAVVMLRAGADFPAVRRETPADVSALDV